MNEMPDDRISEIDRRFQNYRRLIFGVMVAALIANGALFWTLAGPERPGQALMELALVDGWTPPTVCPGERVVFDYVVHIRGAGVFTLDRTLWRVSPPMTLVFSQSQQGVYPAPIDFAARREWMVPMTYTNPVNEQPAKLTAGAYEWRWAMSTVSRSTLPSILTLPFRVKEGCE